ncbi:MAG: DUF3179 domain-containing protein [Bacteroidota bacterium]
MQILRAYSFLIMLVILGACSKESNTNPNIFNQNNSAEDEWLIPINEVRDGGPGKDGIPSIDSPSFSGASQINFLDSEDIVIVLRSKEEVKAYPHRILDWHEITNEELSNGATLALTYCPLTGTAIGWNADLDGQKTTFGVSGLLYNSNLMPYDRATNSTWSQMSHLCVNGELSGEAIETIHVVEMAFSTLREVYPDAKVLNLNTGFNREYNRYPYGDYRTNNQSLIFPVSNRDDRIPNKERVLGVVVNGEALAYRFADFREKTINVVQNSFQRADLVVIGSQEKNILTAYQSIVADGTALTFTALQNEFPAVMMDNEGNKWDVLGQAVSGPRTGEQLPEILNYMGFWFSWAAFNENIEIFER